MEALAGVHEALSEAIGLEATTAERSVLEAVDFVRALRGAKTMFVPEELMVARPVPAGDPVAATSTINVDAFASGQSRKILRDKNRPGMLVRRHLEVC
ncbi:hypothetical protein [Microbispora sitophila]|uniref:hypothetical protein n=1 Tax=Microbispora sitophila TaxID=2771537 RepID=UPI001D0325F7|nr:hypothetical protein [Microbispora sitophila]